MVIQHLLADLGPDGGGMTDGELLARFLSSRDDNALAALVRRHAPMVWGVCRRLLHNHHDAEDAFQATFLVLVRKAADVPRQAVANWLYGVARQTAVRLRATAAKRGRRETQVVNMPEPTVAEVRDADLQAVLDEELSRLPDHYRGVIVLCDLEGMTRKEAARQLGIPEGSVASRLARARAMLAKRLTRRGVVFSGGSVAAVLSAGSASASAPPALVASTIKAASLLAAGQAAGVVSAKVAALTEGVVKAMFVTKLKAAVAVVLVLGLLATVATGAMGLGYHRASAQSDKTPIAPIVEERATPEKDKNATTSDKEVGDLQGEWSVVAMEEGGEKAPADALKGMKWVVRGNEITGSQPGGTGRMSFKLDSGKTPKEIDITALGWQFKGDDVTRNLRDGRNETPGLFWREGPPEDIRDSSGRRTHHDHSGEGSLHRLGQGDQRPASGLGLPPRREAGLPPRRDGHARPSGSQRRQGSGGVQAHLGVLRRESTHDDGRRGQTGPNDRDP